METQAKDGPVGGTPFASDEERALWAAVASCPDDDLPRLVYADWLDEHGRGEQAAFIRLQCAAEADPDRRPRLLGDADRVYSRHQLRWRFLHPGLHPTRVRFRRGFPWEVSVRVPEYRAGGERLQARCPTLRAVRFTDMTPDETEALPHLPHLDRFDRVDFGYNFHPGPRLMRGLADSPWLAGVRELGLRDCRVGEAPAEWLAESAALTADPPARLEALDLSHNLLPLEWVTKVAASPAVRTVRDLNLAHTHLTDAGVRALAASPHLRGVETLTLSGNPVGPEGLRALRNSPHLSRLHTLITSGEDRATTVWSASARHAKPPTHGSAPSL